MNDLINKIREVYRQNVGWTGNGLANIDELARMIGLFDFQFEQESDILDLLWLIEYTAGDWTASVSIEKEGEEYVAHTRSNGWNTSRFDDVRIERLNAVISTLSLPIRETGQMDMAIGSRDAIYNAPGIILEELELHSGLAPVMIAREGSSSDILRQDTEMVLASLEVRMIGYFTRMLARATDRDS